MMTRPEPVVTGSGQRRVVVLLDASRQGRLTLEAALDLAAWHRVPLLALSVREESLLRGAALAFTMEYGAVTGQGRRVDAVRLQARFKAQESRFRMILEEAAGARGLSCSLVIRTGDVVREALALLQSDDLLVMGKCVAPGLLGGRLGGSCRALIQASPAPLLLWEQPLRAAGPVMLSLSDTSGLNPAWRMQSVLDWFQSTGQHGVVQRLNAGTPAHQLRRAAQYSGGLLVLSQSLAADPERLAGVRLPILVWPDR
ncbi:MAG: universal stress protein [Pseudomonadota bacterium]